MYFDGYIRERDPKTNSTGVACWSIFGVCTTTSTRALAKSRIPSSLAHTSLNCCWRIESEWWIGDTSIVFFTNLRQSVLGDSDAEFSTPRKFFFRYSLPYAYGLLPTVYFLLVFYVRFSIVVFFSQIAYGFQLRGVATSSGAFPAFVLCLPHFSDVPS